MVTDGIICQNRMLENNIAQNNTVILTAIKRKENCIQ